MAWGFVPSTYSLQDSSWPVSCQHLHIHHLLFFFICTLCSSLTNLISVPQRVTTSEVLSLYPFSFSASSPPSAVPFVQLTLINPSGLTLKVTSLGNSSLITTQTLELLTTDFRLYQYCLVFLVLTSVIVWLSYWTVNSRSRLESVLPTILSRLLRVFEIVFKKYLWDEESKEKKEERKEGRKEGRKEIFFARFQNASTMTLLCLLHIDCPDWLSRWLGLQPFLSHHSTCSVYTCSSYELHAWQKRMLLREETPSGSIVYESLCSFGAPQHDLIHPLWEMYLQHPDENYCQVQAQT